MPTPVHAWNAQFTLACRAAFYAFIASAIRRKARAIESVDSGWVCDDHFVAAAGCLLSVRRRRRRAPL